MVFCSGVRNSSTRFWFGIPFFHLPIFGGWKDYVVLEPKDDSVTWNIGWITDEVIGVSRVKTKGQVRVLIGSSVVKFFGIDADGNQITIQEIARGRIGDGGPYAKTPLL